MVRDNPTSQGKMSFFKLKMCDAQAMSQTACFGSLHATPLVLLMDPFVGPQGVVPERFDPRFSFIGTRVIPTDFRLHKTPKNMHNKQGHTISLTRLVCERIGRSLTFDILTLQTDL